MMGDRDEGASGWVHDEARERSACRSVPPERMPLALHQDGRGLCEAVPRRLQGTTLGVTGT
jgi:hypothetical protein